MKIALVTTTDARDLRTRSGTPFFMAHALRRAGLQVELVGPLGQSWSLRRSTRAAVAKLAGRTYLRDREPKLLRALAAETARRLERIDYDVVLSPSTLPVALLNVQRPVVTWSDATFAQMVDYYPGFTSLTRASRRNGAVAEASALSRASLVIYPSRWAAESAVNDYGVDRARLAVIPFGANLIDEPDEAKAVEAALVTRRMDDIRLVFVGIEWERKGGDTAFAIVRALRQRGRRAHLTIIGCSPQIPADLRSHTSVIGFLDKANPADRTRFSEILTRAHFLVHPAHAECSGIVLCEANAYAVPCLASDTGGIPELIRPGINGALFPTNSDGTSYADFIVDCLSDHGKYYALARNAYEEYRRSLNWRTSGSRARNEIERILMLGPPAVVPEQGNGGPRDPIAPNRGNGLKIELGDVEPLSPSHPV